MPEQAVDPLIIDSDSALRALCQRMSTRPWLAVDTEFMRERTYYPQLCVVQLADEEEIACIDALAVENMQPLGELLLNTATTKVFHAAHQDLEVIHGLFGTVPAPVFDTQIAATLAGLTPQIGYARLVSELLGVELDKQHTRSDWARRPLPEAAWHYAADDVRWLREVYLQLREQLENSGRLQWLEADFTALSDPRRYQTDPDEAWRRIRQTDRLRPEAFTILCELAAWREREAMQHNRPRQWILRDEMLVDIARRRPASAEELKQIRGVADAQGRGKTDRDELLQTVARAARLPTRKPPRRNDQKLTAHQQPVVDLLMAVMRECARDAGIASSMIGGRREVEKLVGGERALALLEGWRGRIAGQTMLAVLEGRTMARVEGDSLLLETPAGTAGV